MSFNERPRRRAAWTGRRGGADLEPDNWMNLPGRHPPATDRIRVGVRAVVPWNRVVVIEHELTDHFDLAADVLPEEVVGPGRLELGPIVGRDLDYHARLRQTLLLDVSERV